jgi:hypothetical protein
VCVHKKVVTHASVGSGDGGDTSTRPIEPVE